MSIKIITDSGSDFTPEEAKKRGVILLPMNVRFDQDEYQAGFNLTNDEFYDKLVETDVFPKTSAIAPGVYDEAFEEIQEAGDEAIYISVTSELSGTMQSAKIAAEDYEDCISIVDSRLAAAGQYILVEQALIYRNQGLSRQEIVERLEEDKEHIKVIALLDTLEYLKKGGRINAAAATIGNVLSIKPVVIFDEGLVKLFGKAKGSKNGQNKLMQFVKDNGGINFDRPFALFYSGYSDALLQKYKQDSYELYKEYPHDLPVIQVGPIIGTYAGPGAIGFAFFEK
ncbi:MAG: DegV family protein [Lachnospiraceae bacterium]|nr:DegV family protein [Lachnospiraceae bacterium]